MAAWALVLLCLFVVFPWSTLAIDDGIRQSPFGNRLQAWLVVAMVIAGVVLVWRWTSPIRHRPSDMRPQEPGSGDSAWIEAFGIYLALFIAYSSLSGLLASSHLDRILATWGFLLLAWIPVAWIGRSGDRGRLAPLLGVTARRPVLAQVLAGFLGYLAGLPLILLAVAGAALIAPYFAQADHPVGTVLAAGTPSPLVIALLFGLVSGFAPLVEETMFRGVLLRHLMDRNGTEKACVISAGIFAAAHPQGPAAFPPLIAIGLVLGAIRVRHDSLIASMTAHGVHNGTLLLILLIAMKQGLVR